MSGCLLRHILCSAFTKADSVCFTARLLFHRRQTHFCSSVAFYCLRMPLWLTPRAAFAIECSRSDPHREKWSAYTCHMCSAGKRCARSLLQLSDAKLQAPAFLLRTYAAQAKESEIDLAQRFWFVKRCRNKTKCVFVNLLLHNSHCWQILSYYLLLTQFE